MSRVVPMSACPSMDGLYGLDVGLGLGGQVRTKLVTLCLLTAVR